jgi:hypothetical protein
MIDTFATSVMDCEGHKYELHSVELKQLWITPVDGDAYSVNKKDFSDFETLVYNFLVGL